MLRKLLLDAAAQPRVRSFVTHHPATRDLARRFVAGETLGDGLRAVGALNARGLKVSLDHLGENTTTPDQARAAAAAYLDILDRIDAGRLDANVSLKLTQLGLDVDAAACERHLREIVARAAAHGSFVRIDMESSAYTARKLSLFRRV
jgi:proline dehydrogenase